MSKAAALFLTLVPGQRRPKGLRASVATKIVKLALDRHSQATDPIALKVNSDVHAAVRNGGLVALGLRGQQLDIPAANVRLSVSGKSTLLSLVGLGALTLPAGTFRGAVRAIRTHGRSPIRTIDLAVFELSVESSTQRVRRKRG
jgi:hypothetical protein